MKKIATTIFASLCLMTLSVQAQEAPEAEAQTVKPLSKEQLSKDANSLKNISKVGTWTTKKLQKNGREVDILAHVGEVTMKFSSRVLKKNKKIELANGKTKTKKVKETVNSFKMDMGGSDRIFDYTVAQDSVRFVGVSGFNDFRIVRADKGELVLEQSLDGDLLRWYMEPLDEKKKK